MKTTITKDQVAHVVQEALPVLAVDLARDVEAGLHAALARETSARAAEVLSILLQNAQVARQDGVPLCQDTGSVWVCLEIGPDVGVMGDIFAGVDSAVAQAYTEHALRKSMVRKAVFDRTNTTNNTPAFCEIRTTNEPGARLHIMLKGGGSDNASRVVMLEPYAGVSGIKEALLACVHEKAAAACPPLIIGVGIGATFDTVPHLSKRALMRPLNKSATNEEVAAFEDELLTLVNDTGIGAGALGGATTALAVHVEVAPCHIAALPLAINMGCSALRRGSYELI